jgi:hypothetical protein
LEWFLDSIEWFLNSIGMVFTFGWLDDNGAGELQRLLEGRGDGKGRDLEVAVEEVGGAVGTRLWQPAQAEHLLAAVLKAEDLTAAHPPLRACSFLKG